MIRIRKITAISSIQEKKKLDQVMRVYQEAFPYYPQYLVKLKEYISFPEKLDFRVNLIVAENEKSRLLGFALYFIFPEINYAYLDYIASNKKHRNKGIGSTLYESLFEELEIMNIKGLLMDVPPDEEVYLKEKNLLKINKRRMAFYERFGARPIINTAYNSTYTKANKGYFTFLVYAPIREKILPKKYLRKFIIKLLEIKGNINKNDDNLIKIIQSIKDDPVKIREPIYLQAANKEKKSLPLLKKLNVVSVSQKNSIHHIKERGYVERPARIDAIIKSLNELSCIYYETKKQPLIYLKEVHDRSLINFLSQAKQKLRPGELIYPNIFPIRRPDKEPRTWEIKAGYYCIDTFTPVTVNVYDVACEAYNSVITGAKILISGKAPVYVVCRPPGHHAEKKNFGGFCYFNNAAIAANFLSKYGKVALLDIDYHHANGSQDIFYDRKDVLVVSIHGHPEQAYPYFAGYRDEKGQGDGYGYNVNFPLYPSTNEEKYLAVLDNAIRIIKKYSPTYLVVSLGYDTMKGDPTGNFSITAKGMREIGRKIGMLNFPAIIVQEGGYSLNNLKTGSKNFFLGFLSE